MEGVRDGFAAEDCFVCGLLWPGTSPCPRCGGAVRWQHAAIVDDAHLAGAYQRWCGDGDRDALAAFLTALHAEAPDSLAQLDGLGTDLDALRAAWARLAPDQKP